MRVRAGLLGSSEPLSAQHLGVRWPCPCSADAPWVVGLVTVLTESLRVLGVGKKQYEEVIESSAPVKRLRRGDVNGVIRGIKKDFAQGYIITGERQREPTARAEAASESTVWRCA